MEKSINELGDKITDADQAVVNEAITKLKETLKSDNIEAIKADTEALQKAFYPIAEKLYSAQSQSDMGANTADNNTYYDAGFEDKTGV
jgi:molecular chaperone DnaK